LITEKNRQQEGLAALARAGMLSFAVVSMTACGAQSSASNNDSTVMEATGSAMNAVALAQAASAATSPVALPIERGVYAEAAEGCARAAHVFFYDGSHYGKIYHAVPATEPNGASTVEYIASYQLQRVGPSAEGRDDYADDFRGFTRVWGTPQTEDAYEFEVGIKPAGPGRFTWLEGEAGATSQFMANEATYQTCAFTQLSTEMQAAIRSLRPQLAGDSVFTSGDGAVVSSVPAPVSPFNIRPGHYVPVAALCSTANEMIFYFDGRRAGWIDNTPFNPNRMDSVAGARQSGKSWLLDPTMDETLRVEAPDRITIGDPNTGVETMRWCPASEVRASARTR